MRQVVKKILNFKNVKIIQILFVYYNVIKIKINSKGRVKRNLFMWIFENIFLNDCGVKRLK